MELNMLFYLINCTVLGGISPSSRALKMAHKRAAEERGVAILLAIKR